MKHYIILLFLFTLFCCSKQENKNFNGTNWERFYVSDNKTEFFPFELSFKKDSLILTDGYNYKHKIKYRIINDSIEMYFKKNIKKVYFKTYSDSITIDSINFYKSREISSKNKPYDLIDYQSKEIFSYNYSSVIHLVKVNNKTNVILNDNTNDLNDIPSFLSGCFNGKPPPPVTLYIEKGITFNELLETYLWIKFMNIHKVTLVTKNESYERFYSMKDNINIDESLINEFSIKNNLPPSSPSYNIPKGKERKIVKIDNQTELEQILNINDSIQYLFKISDKIDLIKYLKLTEKINSQKNIRKEITAYNKG